MGGMMNKRQRWSLAGVAGVLAAVTLLVVPALGQVGSEVGVLHLELDSGGDRFLFVPSDGGEPTQQLLTASNCRLGDTSDASLVDVVGSGSQTNKRPYAGLKDHRLGVGQNGEGNGEPCGRINRDLNQFLTLSLTGDLQGQAIDYAEINLGFKFNGDAILETSLAGEPVDTITVACNDASDCGPDSGGSDNKLVILTSDSADPDVASITGPFDTIVIRPGDAAVNGAISLEDDSLFRLVEAFDGEIDCTENEILIESEDATFSVTRGYDTDGGCKGPADGLLYTFAAGTEDNELFVDFITEPVEDNPATVFAQFLEEITWEFPSPPDVPTEPQHRTLSYDDHVGIGKRVMPWCLEDPRDGAGNLPGGVVDPDDYLPAGHTSCLIEVSSYVSPDGTFTTVHTIYNIGDGKRWT
jgi:hypothetical protein